MSNGIFDLSIQFWLVIIVKPYAMGVFHGKMADFTLR